MFLKSVGSTLSAFEPVACCPSSLPDRPSSTLNFLLGRKSTSSCSRRPLLWRHMDKMRCSNPSHTSKNWKMQSADQAQLIALVDEEKKMWEDCRLVLSAFNFTVEEADQMLKKAFGWVHSPYWGEERRKEVPKVKLVNEILDYLKCLGLSDDDLHKLLKKFPEVLGCDLDAEMKNNVGVLEKEWGIKGKTLRNLLLRNPKVLGYNVDCKGNCMAQCTRCWVRF